MLETRPHLQILFHTTTFQGSMNMHALYDSPLHLSFVDDLKLMVGSPIIGLLGRQWFPIYKGILKNELFKNEASSATYVSYGATSTRGVSFLANFLL